MTEHQDTATTPTTPPAESKVGFSLFAALWCVVEQRPFPRHQQAMANFLEQSWRGGERQLLLMAFRASGKSTMVGLFCAWLLYQDNNLRILVLSAEQSLATKMVRAVRHLFDRHPLLKPLKPQSPEQWARDEFIIERPLVLRDPSMVARGIYGNITGFRADVVICDDVEVINNSHNSDQRGELRRRLAEVDFILTPRGDSRTEPPIATSKKETECELQLYVGTPHGVDSIYNTATNGFLAGFQPFVMPVMDEHGQSVWPEKFTASHIKNLAARQGQKKFLSQMMLKVEGESAMGLNHNRLQEYDGELLYSERNRVAQLCLVGQRLAPRGVHGAHGRHGAFNIAIDSIGCFWDPAFGASNKNADGSVVAVMARDQAGHYYLHELVYLNQRLDEHAAFGLQARDNPAMAQIAEVMMIMERNFARGIMIENNGLGKFLPGLLRQEIKKQAKLWVVNEVSHRQSKRTRIFAAFDSLLSAGALQVNQKLRHGDHGGRFYNELADFQLNNDKSHDDGLDAVAGCIESPFYKIHAPAHHPNQPS